jgi:hypothetical protein
MGAGCHAPDAGNLGLTIAMGALALFAAVYARVMLWSRWRSPHRLRLLSTDPRTIGAASGVGGAYASVGCRSDLVPFRRRAEDTARYGVRPVVPWAVLGVGLLAAAYSSRQADSMDCWRCRDAIRRGFSTGAHFVGPLDRRASGVGGGSVVQGNRGQALFVITSSFANVRATFRRGSNHC